MNYFVLLCGGNGKRMNLDIPKQYLKYKNNSLYYYSLLSAVNTKLFKKIFIVANEKYFNLIKEETKLFKNIELIKSGKTRQESVYNALISIKDIKKNDLVAIHDGARVFLKSDLIQKLINYAKLNNSAIPYKKCSSSIFDLKKYEYLNKDNLIEIETPQVFKLNEILKAHLDAINNKILDSSDDGFLYLKYIAKPNYILNKDYNLKITTINDLKEIEIRL